LIHSKKSLTKELKIAIALFVVPASGDVLENLVNEGLNGGYKLI
jgi:hypothetical protein